MPLIGNAAATIYVSYGILLDGNEEIGVAIYADPLCMSSEVVTEAVLNADVTLKSLANSPASEDTTKENVAALGLNLYWGNCVGASSAGTAGTLTNTVAEVRSYINAIEFKYSVPYEIPNDRTEAVVSCGLTTEGDLIELNLLNVHA